MNNALRIDAERIARGAIDAVRPDGAVRRALESVTLTGNIYLVAVGKAAWQMASAAVKYLPFSVKDGIVLTKYGHVMEPLPGIACLEAGHPVPDENSFAGTRQILEMTKGLSADDTVLFLLSGGGSALFEEPLVEPELLQEVTQALLARGADIGRINTIRKRLSAVKGGRFAQWCAPAKVEAVILSDVLGDPVDLIASGPASADPSTSEDSKTVAREYLPEYYETLLPLLEAETPKSLSNVHTQIIGSVRQLCVAAEHLARELGYEPVFLTDRMECEARNAGRELGKLLARHSGDKKRVAYLAGGETVVHVTGTGLGGRNQELALAAAEALSGIPNAAIISVGSDGTDGPTGAAGGYADGDTLAELKAAGIDYHVSLTNNDAYHALDAIGNLIFTGPTGTNVNDITIGLIG